MLDINDIDLSDYQFTIKSRDPWVILIHDFLSDAEIISLLNTAQSRFQRSFVVGKDSSTTLDENRTSSSSMFRQSETEILSAIEDRVCKITKMPKTYQEPFQLVRYDKDQKYSPHFDYFHTNEPYAENEVATRGQRCMTILAYLIEPVSGGSTYFPKLSMHIQPRKGSAILWFNTDKDGNVLEKTEHGGMPVHEGTKVAMNIWVRNKKYM